MITDSLAGFAAQVKDENPVHAAFLDAAIAQLLPDERAGLERYLGFCRGQGLSAAEIADAYNTIVNDTLMEQIYFQREGTYRHSSFQEVADAVYFNDDYMRRYMYGLAITGFLWPNHAALHRFFLDTLPRRRGGRYLEVGPGHGFYFMKAMELSGCDHYTGVDISRTSLDLTDAIVREYLPERVDDVSLVEADFLELEAGDEPFDLLVMGEVLEHVETPVRFLEKLAELAAPDARVFVTTCVNAPAIDHIYLYPDVASVENQLTGSGFTIVDKLLAPYTGKTLDECRELSLAINVAYVLRPG